MKIFSINSATVLEIATYFVHKLFSNPAMGILHSEIDMQTTKTHTHSIQINHAVETGWYYLIHHYLICQKSMTVWQNYNLPLHSSLLTHTTSHFCFFSLYNSLLSQIMHSITHWT